MSDRKLTEEERAELVDALALLHTHYSGNAQPVEIVDAAKLTVAHVVTAWQMGTLVFRLCNEGYIRDDRLVELRERGVNLAAGRGFLTNAELAGKGASTDPKPKDETEELLS